VEEWWQWLGSFRLSIRLGLSLNFSQALTSETMAWAIYDAQLVFSTSFTATLLEILGSQIGVENTVFIHRRHHVDNRSCALRRNSQVKFGYCLISISRDVPHGHPRHPHVIWQATVEKGQ